MVVSVLFHLTFVSSTVCFFSPLSSFVLRPSSSCCVRGPLQWTVWILHVPTMASVWTGSATANPGGGGSTVSCPEPSAQTSATDTEPSYLTPGCAAATPTGWDPTAPWVSVGWHLGWHLGSCDGLPQNLESEEKTAPPVCSIPYCVVS